MKTYYRLTFEEREEISRLLSQRYSFNAIGKHLGRDKGTISREASSTHFLDRLSLRDFPD